MAVSALGVTRLIQNLLETTSSNRFYSKEIAYADDFAAVSSVKDIEVKVLLGTFEFISSIFRLLSKASKSHLIVKSQYFKCCLWSHQN